MDHLRAQCNQETVYITPDLNKVFLTKLTKLDVFYLQLALTKKHQNAVELISPFSYYLK